MKLWTTGTFKWGLWESDWTPNESTQIHVADITGTEYAGASGYTRQTVTTPTVTVTLPATPGTVGFISYLADDPAFGVLTGTVSAAWLVLYEFVTSDADSPLIAAYQVAFTADSVTAATFPLPEPYGALSVATTYFSAF